MHALDRSGVVLARVLEFRIAFITLAGLLRAPAAVALAVGVRALDEFLLDARLVLAVVVGNIVGAIAPITANLAGVELRAAA